jgi:hypothetical protein
MEKDVPRRRLGERGKAFSEIDFDNLGTSFA